MKFFGQNTYILAILDIGNNFFLELSLKNLFSCVDFDEC